MPKPDPRPDAFENSLIVTECARRDAMDNHMVYFLMAQLGLFRLHWGNIMWRSLDLGERYTMIASGNYFDTPEEAIAARDRALTKPKGVTPC